MFRYIYSMQKLGYVAGCLGLEITADLLGISYRHLTENYFSDTAFSLDHRTRINVAADILVKAGSKAHTDQCEMKRWLTAQLRILNGATPVQFISRMKASSNTRAEHALIQMAPAGKAFQHVTLAA